MGDTVVWYLHKSFEKHVLFFICTNNDIALTLLQQNICRCLPAARHLVDRVVRLVHGHEEHGEAELEQHQDSQELAQVDHQAADNDGPGTEQVVERQEVQDLENNVV